MAIYLQWPSLSLSTTVTSQNGHLARMAISLQWPPLQRPSCSLYNSNLSKMATSPEWPSLYKGCLSMTAACLQRSPFHQYTPQHKQPPTLYNGSRATFLCASGQSLHSVLLEPLDSSHFFILATASLQHPLFCLSGQSIYSLLL